MIGFCACPPYRKQCNKDDSGSKKFCCAISSSYFNNCNAQGYGKGSATADKKSIF